MEDKFGLKAAADHGIALGEVGQKVLLENEFIRMWEVRLEPGQTIDFHIHFHPYLVISLGGGENEIETIFGKKISVQEPAGSFVFMNEMREVHRLTNKSNVTYLSRLIEIKSATWRAGDSIPAAPRSA
jgi:quercetin dioxygenase-like cupin family protein